MPHLTRKDHAPRALRFPLPFRCHHRTESGLWGTHQWTPDDLKSAHTAGGYENGTQDLAPKWEHSK